MPVWDFVEGEPSRWVTIHAPEKTWTGYTLALYRQRTPMLLDMNGRIVHAWPDARVRTRVRLLPNGNLLGISLAKGVVEYDWEGNEVWSFQPDRGFVHHDVIRLASGNTMMLVQGKRGPDDVLEVDRAGATVWRWPVKEGLRQFRPEGRVGGDWVHLNSVQELPSNRWFDAGDERFRPGNLLLSSRHLDRILIVDRAGGEVTWSWADGLDRQHEALMVPKGWPGAGNIQVFNNRYRSYRADRQSEVLEIDPGSGDVVWRYTDETFHSPTSALSQPLPNGNVLVSSSRGGRAFEVTRDGTVVWQWTPPFEPRRPQRYAPDHAPQLRSLPRRALRAVAPPETYRYVDRVKYQFARGRALRKVRIAGERKTVLAQNALCGRVLVPGLPTLLAEYGIDPRKMNRAGLRGSAVRFTLTWRADGDSPEAPPQEPETLIEETLTAAQPWRARQIAFDAWAQRQGEICVEAAVEDAPETPSEPFAFWVPPGIDSGHSANAVWTHDGEGLTEQELEVRRRHLETLGYVD